MLRPHVEVRVLSMAESIYMGSGTAANDLATPPRRRPATAGSPAASPTALMALSHPDRKSMEPAGGSWKSGSLKHPPSVAKARPSTALTGLRVTGMAVQQSDGISSPQEAPPRIFGRMSLYDAIDDNTEAHAFFGEIQPPCISSLLCQIRFETEV